MEEDGWLVAGGVWVFLEEGFCFRAEGDVSDYDRAALFEEELDDAEVDAYVRLLSGRSSHRSSWKAYLIRLQ